MNSTSDRPLQGTRILVAEDDAILAFDLGYSFRHNQPVAKLVSELPKPKPALRPPPGLGKGFITIVSDDEEHLTDFAEYMP